MEQKKNLCAHIPITLHTRVRQEQEKSGKTLSEYITEILTSYFEGGTNMASRTLAIQISEELFEKFKAHIAAESQRQDLDCNCSGAGLSAIPKGYRTDAVCQVLLRQQEQENLRKLIREVVHEELKHSTNTPMPDIQLY